MWPWLMPRLARARLPEFVADIMRLFADGRIGRAHGRRDSMTIVVDTALMYGSFDHVRATRTWSRAPSFWCRVCGDRQEGHRLKPWMLESYSPWQYCEACSIRIRSGRATTERSEILRGVRRLRGALERVPPQGVHYESLAGLDSRKRDEVAAALIVAPDPKFAMGVIGGNWLDVLRAAGLVDGAWRPGRGTYCRAADGHLCRSLGELAVDDWLAARRIEHDLEPRYPGSSRRADWRLPDGTFIEYAGMLLDEAYARKLAEKRAIAQDAGVRLVVLVPEDLGALERRLGEWLAWP
jgi:hypothetical protein